MLANRDFKTGSPPLAEGHANCTTLLFGMQGTPRPRRTRSALTPLLEIERGNGPLLATSIHAGHGIRDSLQQELGLSDAERLREEDPFTELWATVCPNRVVVHRSRFEVDLNRAPMQAIYKKPEDAWGLRVWRTPLSDASVAESMREYRAYYATVLEVLEDLEREHGRFVVLDLHSYNHRREGALAPPADPRQNPDVNVGTGSMDRARWGHLVDRFIAELGAQSVLGHRLDVRENVRFQGGYQCHWVHDHFPVTGCALAIEVKKFFMDEWTGQPEAAALSAIQTALASTLPGLMEELFR